MALKDELSLNLLERGQAELCLCLGQVDHVGCSSHLQKFAEFSRVVFNDFKFCSIPAI